MATPEERKKLAAEQYLAENRVRWLLENVTSDLVRFFPSNPYQFIRQRVKEISESNHLDIQRHKIVAVLGGPASGKGVVCASLAQELGTITVAPNELLRNEIKDGTDVGQRVGEMLHSSTVPPKEIIANLIKKKIESQTEKKNPMYAMDRYPRGIEMALHFEQNVAEVSKVIYLKVSEDTMRKRMAERAQEQGLEDDEEPKRTEKITSFMMKTLPVVEYYRALGRVIEIDAEQPIEVVVSQVERHLRKS